MVDKRVWNAVLGCNLKNNRMISDRFWGKPFNITVIHVYAPTSNAEEAEVEWFYEDLQDLLELTPPKDVLFIIGDWNAKVGSQETPGVTGKFGLGIWNAAGQMLIEFCQESSVQFSSVAQSCLTLCDPMNCSMPGLPDHHQLPEFTQTHIHWVSDAIQPSHPLLFPSPPAPNPSQHQSLFQWVNSSHEVAGWHHWLNGCESEWTLGVGDGQGGLVCCDSWGRRVRYDWVTELNWLNNSNYIWPLSALN